MKVWIWTDEVLGGGEVVMGVYATRRLARRAVEQAYSQQAHRLSWKPYGTGAYGLALDGLLTGTDIFWEEVEGMGVVTSWGGFTVAPAAAQVPKLTESGLLKLMDDLKLTEDLVRRSPLLEFKKLDLSELRKDLAAPSPLLKRIPSTSSPLQSPPPKAIPQLPEGYTLDIRILGDQTLATLTVAQAQDGGTQSFVVPLDTEAGLEAAVGWAVWYAERRERIRKEADVWLAQHRLETEARLRKEAEGVVQRLARDYVLAGVRDMQERATQIYAEGFTRPKAGDAGLRFEGPAARQSASHAREGDRCRIDPADLLPPNSPPPGCPCKFCRPPRTSTPQGTQR